MRIRASSFLIALHLTSSVAQPAWSEIFKGYPDVIVCPYGAAGWQDKGGHAVFYVDTHQSGGNVHYKPLGKLTIIVVVGADGVVKADRLDKCNGKTVQQLRDAGRAFDLIEPQANDTSPINDANN